MFVTRVCIPATSALLKSLDIVRRSSVNKLFRTSLQNSQCRDCCDDENMGSKACDDCRQKCGKGRVPMEQLLAMEEAYETLQKSDQCHSLVKKHLTRKTFDMLKELQTPMGATLMDCIQSGVMNLDAHVGLYAADADCYSVFLELFNPVIEEYHGVKKGFKHPTSHWGNPDVLTPLDPSGKYIQSIRVRTGRNLDAYPFNPSMKEKDYEEVEKRVSTALNSLRGDHQGTYYPLALMTPTQQQKLIDEHFLFQNNDRHLQAANALRFWPKGRGIFYNPKKNFLVWVCEEDHMRIISMQPGGDLQQVYRRLAEALEHFDKMLSFARSSRLGFQTFCPSNLGTAIRASVHIKLPKLSQDIARMEKECAKHNIQVRGADGENSKKTAGGIFDLSNKRRLGLTEFEAVKEMHTGIQALLRMEENM